MAEFTEVMRQWVRMCDANKYCSNCRIKKENLPYTLCSEGGIRSVENIADTELAIMSWAAEHPEPVYPTWAEWLTSIGVYPKGWEIYQTPLKQDIPADIAKKLGLKPKEPEC